MKVLTLLLAFAVFPAALRAQKQNAPLPPEVKVVSDLEYSRPGGGPLLLDLYLPTEAPEILPPVVIWVHGGGWKAGSKDKCPGVWLVSHGYAVACLNYRLIPDHQWPAQIDDCRAAVRWLRDPENAKVYGFDPSRIAAWGGSAGGHLVALMGTLEAPEIERVQAVVDWYGPSDLLTQPPNVLAEGRTREDLAKANGAFLLGGIVMDMPERAKSASALHQVSRDDAPFLIMHGEVDPMVPVEQSRRLHEKLLESGVESTLHTFPGVGHGGPEFNKPQIREWIREFLDRHLKVPIQ